MRDKLIDVVVILFVPLIYSLTADSEYARALGFSAFGGLLGMAVYQVILTKRYSLFQSKLRRYAIGTVLFSLVGIPVFVSQVQGDREADELKGYIGSLLGKVYGACEISDYVKKSYCPAFVVAKDIENSCSKKLEDVIPARIKVEFNSVLDKQKFKEMIVDLKKKVDDSFVVIANNGSSREDACKKYEEFVTSTYKSSVDEIASRKDSLR